MKQTKIYLLLFLIQVCSSFTAQSQHNSQSSEPYPCYDSNNIRHQVVGIFCNGARIDALKSTKCSGEPSNLNLQVSGKDISGFDKFLLEAKQGEIYAFALLNANVAFVNGASDIFFNPQANFFYVQRGESYFELNQNTKIYLPDKLIVWALDSSQINIKRDSNQLHETIELCLLKGKAKLQIENEGRELQEGKLYTYSNNNLKETDADTTGLIAWTKETFNHKSIPCNSLINEFGRWYNLPVVYKYKIPTFKLSFEGNFAEPLSQNLGRLHGKKRNVFCYIEDDKISVEYK